MDRCRTHPQIRHKLGCDKFGRSNSKKVPAAPMRPADFVSACRPEKEPDHPATPGRNGVNAWCRFASHRPKLHLANIIPTLFVRVPRDPPEGKIGKRCATSGDLLTW